MPVTGTKLSQFPIAGSPPAATDVFVGVQSPTGVPTDFLYTVAQAASAIGPLLAGTPVNSIQFNNAGTFGGDANFIWTIGSGEINKLHEAIGNFGVIDTITQYPGDPINATTSTAPTVLSINENMIATDTNPRYGLSVSIGYTNNTDDEGLSSHGSFYNQMFLNSNSTQNIGFVGASNNFLVNFAPVHVDSLDCMYFQAVNEAGNCDDIYAVVGYCTNIFGTGNSVQGENLRVFAGGTASVQTVVGIQITVGTSSRVSPGATCVNQYGIKITNASPTNAGSTLTNNYGLDIQDQSVMNASSRNWNIWSEGNASINKFDGILRLGPATTDPSPVDGDLWYDGTHLNFRKGAATIVLA